jgi:rubrerythrin
MAHTFEELNKKTVAELREIASEIEHEAVEGYTQLRKEPLLKGILTALGIEAHQHHDVVGIDKRTLKAQIRELKTKRDAFLVAHDHRQLKLVRRKIHHLKRKIRAATV